MFYDLYIVPICTCNKHPPIFVFFSVGKSFGFTDKTQRQIEQKSVKKFGLFFLSGNVGDFFVCGEIFWWDTSFRVPTSVNIRIHGIFTLFDLYFTHLNVMNDLFLDNVSSNSSIPASVNTHLCSLCMR